MAYRMMSQRALLMLVVLASAVLLGIAGCSTTTVDATQLIVVVNSDLQVGTQLTAVEVEIQAADGVAEQPELHRFELSQLQEEGRFRLPLSFGVVKGGSSSNFRLIARGFGPGPDGLEAVVVEQRSLVSFEKQKTQRLVVFLGGPCLGVLCPNSEESCYPSGQGAVGVCTALTEANVTRVDPGEEFEGVVLGSDDASVGGDGDTEQDSGPQPVPQFAVSVTLAGDGVGSVTSSVGGIDCGATCSGNVDQGAVVTLTATAGENSQFDGWSGGGCAGLEPCSVTASATTAVTATFVQSSYPLHVNLGGNGVGVVSTPQAEISCGSDCDESFPRGTVVELSAAATAGTSFFGWNGAGCDGASSTCTITVNGPVNVLANFACTPTPGSQTFVFTGAPEVLTGKPACVRTITVDVRGAAGGRARESEQTSPGPPAVYAVVGAGYYGYGARVQATLAVEPTNSITVFVGGRGGDGVDNVGGGAGGFNGGGAGGSSGTRWSGGGGGASDIRLNFDPAAAEDDQLGTRIVVAGGGGGGLACNTMPQGPDGGSAGEVGEAPFESCYPAYSTFPGGGTQSGGGIGGFYDSTAYGYAESGSLGKGGNARSTTSSGGGGGGYYGGGAGMWEAGAGGSSYAVSTATGVVFSTGYLEGYVKISW